MINLNANSVFGHKYHFHSELPMTSLEKYKGHRRLETFYHKGTTCVTCGRVGTRLIQGLDPQGGIHTDVYCDDMTMITVDHIIPRSLGGHDGLDNKQPMCGPCNSRKGNGKQQTKKKIDPVLARAKKFRKKVNRAVKRGFTFTPASVNINVLKVMKFNK